ncbi:hypothetical protein [Spiroplasma sp. BIUS-1]|uniref:hypothetical protein n=1 Tax=Spiroplasma sp. BIUS-1 TaxID=216964 RepID=UPI001397C5FB|nr:hypothetical protein [Spiroplasma sp. BIUS-1]QHX36653.1 hypothetical protein SBIUS_v1c04000 [Spiroplasma sp. BIUS-1]
MKKILTILSSVLLTPMGATFSVSCDPVVSVPSKSYQGTTSELNIFFNNKNTIKPYDLNYLEYINDSWEHFGFESSLSSNKIDITSPSVSENDQKFINVLTEIYKPSSPNDFTGLTIVVENIFLNSINVKRSEDGVYKTKVQSDLALTIQKGWKEQGKILASITNSTDLNKLETFSFINKIITGIGFGLKVNDEQKTDEKTGDEYYEVKGSLSDKERPQFTSKLISSAQSKLSLNLTDSIKFDKTDKSKMTIDGMEYRFV